MTIVDELRLSLSRPPLSDLLATAAYSGFNTAVVTIAISAVLLELFKPAETLLWPTGWILSARKLLFSLAPALLDLTLV